MLLKAFVAVTDNDWFDFLARQPERAEVNFWQPGGGRHFRALDPGQPLLVKLHTPTNFIAGGGFSATFSIFPESLAWQTFGIQNGAPSQELIHERIEHYRRVEHDPRADYSIGCIILEDPFFLEQLRKADATAEPVNHYRRALSPWPGGAMLRPVIIRLSPLIHGPI